MVEAIKAGDLFTTPTMDSQALILSLDPVLVSCRWAARGNGEHRRVGIPLEDNQICIKTQYVNCWKLEPSGLKYYIDHDLWILVTDPNTIQRAYNIHGQLWEKKRQVLAQQLEAINRSIELLSAIRGGSANDQSK